MLMEEGAAVLVAAAVVVVLVGVVGCIIWVTGLVCASAFFCAFIGFALERGLWTFSCQCGG